jgi:hypothetical protein
MHRPSPCKPGCTLPLNPARIHRQSRCPSSSRPQHCCQYMLSVTRCSYSPAWLIIHACAVFMFALPSACQHPGQNPGQNLGQNATNSLRGPSNCQDWMQPATLHAAHGFRKAPSWPRARLCGSSRCCLPWA